jgi:hypothetical protein
MPRATPHFEPLEQSASRSIIDRIGAPPHTSAQEAHRRFLYTGRAMSWLEISTEVVETFSKDLSEKSPHETSLAPFSPKTGNRDVH